MLVWYRCVILLPAVNSFTRLIMRHTYRYRTTTLGAGQISCSKVNDIDSAVTSA